MSNRCHCGHDSHTHDSDSWCGATGCSCECFEEEWPTKPATLDEMNEWEYEANENPRPNPITLAVRLVRVIAAYHALTARAVRAEADAKRLDWLETKVVNVRESTRYGSMNLFWASPTDEDADTSYAPSDLRKQIDAAAPRPATP